MRTLCWKCNFRAIFGVLPLGFNVKALIPQGITGSPNYFGFLNNLMTLIICESLREIGEVACVTSAWSSRGQTLAISKTVPVCKKLKNMKQFPNFYFGAKNGSPALARHGNSLVVRRVSPGRIIVVLF